MIARTLAVALVACSGPVAQAPGTAPPPASPAAPAAPAPAPVAAESPAPAPPVSVEIACDRRYATLPDDCKLPLARASARLVGDSLEIVLDLPPTLPGYDQPFGFMNKPQPCSGLHEVNTPRPRYPSCKIEVEQLADEPKMARQLRLAIPAAAARPTARLELTYLYCVHDGCIMSAMPVLLTVTRSTPP